jgi:two-component system, OmpR family, sensor kinase
VRGAVEAARAYARTNEIELVLEGDDAPRPVTGDPDALRQAALALIDNSVKLSEPGSTVRVRLRPDGFEVADSGPGFEAADPSALFGRYAQEGAGRRAGGAGLGLAIVGWIAEQHGARMRVEARPEGGAVFRMEFAP